MQKQKLIKSLKQAAIAFGVMSVALLAFNAFGGAALAQIAPLTADDNIVGGQSDARSFVKLIINYFLGFLGLVCVVFIIYAGFLYVTSGTNEENIGKAKNIILYTVVGILVILASAAIVNFALSATTGPSTVSPTGSL